MILSGLCLCLVLTAVYISESSVLDAAHLTWYAPFYSGGGYCSEAISFVLALDKIGFTNLSATHHGDTYRQSFFSGLSSTERDRLLYYDSLNNRRSIQHRSIVDIEICHSEPGAWHAPSPKYHTVRCPTDRRNLLSRSGWGTIIPYNIGRTMFETDRLPSGWAHRINYMDEVWVPTEFAKGIFIRAGVPPQKIVVIGEAVDSDFYQPTDYHILSAIERSELGLPPAEALTPYRTVFLFVGKFEARKGLRLLLHTYFEAFTADDEVLLMILTSAYHSNEDLFSDLNDLLVRERLSVEYVPQPPRYLVLTGVKQEGMPHLYSLASALVCCKWVTNI
jgi:glycosyltransferase involved in cell wall biosynthesis